MIQIIQNVPKSYLLKNNESYKTVVSPQIPFYGQLEDEFFYAVKNGNEEKANAKPNKIDFDISAKDNKKPTKGEFSQINSENEQKSSDRNKKLYKYGAITTGIILLATIIWKRKNISSFFKKLFGGKKSSEPTAPEVPSASGTPSTSAPTNSRGGNSPAGNNAISSTNSVREIPVKFSDITNQNPLLIKYQELNEVFKKQLNEFSTDRYATAEKMNEIKREARDKNISLVPKKELPPNATEAERLKYLEKEVYPVMNVSLSSTKDAYDMFEKYGFNKTNPKLGYANSTFSDFSLRALTADFDRETPKRMHVVIATNEIISRYLDLFDKFAKKEYGDAENLAYIFDRCHHIMNEETALKYIEILKKYMDNEEYVISPQVYFSDSRYGRFKNNEKVVAAIEDLVEYSKSLSKS